MIELYYSREKYTGENAILEFQQDIKEKYTDHLSQIDPEIVDEETLFLIVIYGMLSDVSNEFLSDTSNLEIRENECSFWEVVDQVVTYATVGWAVGKNIGKFVKSAFSGSDTLFIVKIGGFVEEVTFGIIGTVIDGLAGLFDGLFSNDCDCHEASFIGIKFEEQSCDLTKVFVMHDTGQDVEVWEWLINQGTISSAHVFTSIPEVEVMQNNPIVPVQVSGRPVCPEEVDFISTEFINLAPTGNFGKPGTIAIIPIEIISSVGSSSTILYSSSNMASGNIEITFTIPSSIGHVEQNWENAVKIGWHNPGSGIISFTSTNVCSGLISILEVPVTIFQ